MLGSFRRLRGLFAIAKRTPVRPVNRKRSSDLFRRNKRLSKLRGRLRVKRPLSPLSLWGGLRTAPRHRETAYLKIPEKFSFITNPDEAIATIDQMAGSLRDGRVGMLFFDHSECQLLDLCASAVMDTLFLTRKARVERGARKINAGGTYSTKNDDVNVLLVTNGIIRNLNVARPRNISPEMKERLRIFPLKPGYRTPPEQSSDVERTATGLVEFFNSCLAMEGFRLKEDKASNLMDLIAEVVNNAEEHSGDDHFGPRWYAIGYHKRSEVPGKGGECHIVLFNFGLSIFQSLKLPETSEMVKEEISRLADAHRKKGFFDRLIEISQGVFLMRGRFWQEDALWSLYALQEGVSRFRHSPGGEDRGNGTVRLIEFFKKLASEDPKMVILSGRTWILFDGKHDLKTIIRSGEQRKVIAFNDENDLSLPPDPNYVRTLNGDFPGTLVSLKFKLRTEDLAKVSEGLRKDDNRRLDQGEDEQRG